METKEMTFDEMCEIEPKLYHLRRQALADLCDYNHPNFWRYYERIKGQLKQIVGWYGGDDYPKFFRTTEAFDVCHKAIFAGLT